jgi:hypothetical protein
MSVDVTAEKRKFQELAYQALDLTKDWKPEREDRWLIAAALVNAAGIEAFIEREIASGRL